MMEALKSEKLAFKPGAWFPGGWFTLSLIFPLYYGLLSIFFAFSHPYIIQDDARQHVVWLQRFIHPQLFPSDVIADYYRAIAPVGYTTFYAFFAKLGIEPLLLAKVIPLFIGLITSIYGFKLFLQILPIPSAAFLSTLILNQTIWLKDDVISASPRAFLYPLFAAFLYFLVKRSTVPCLITILFQGLLFPQIAFVYLGVLTVRLFQWRDRSLQLSQNRQDYLIWGWGLAIALAVILPFSYHLAELGATFTVEQMKAMPEFGTQGRTRYFGVSLFDFVMNGSSGIRPPLLPLVIWTSLGLPFLLKSQHSVSRLITPKIKVLAQILIASLGLFLLAHLLLPKLYYPNRYTYHSLRFVMAIAASIVLFAWLKSAQLWLTRRLSSNKDAFTLKETCLTGLAGLFIAASVLIPATPALVFLVESWNVGSNPAIYEFLAAQPKDILIASLDDEADNIPAFAQRSVLVSGEFAFAFHVNYYSEMKQRAEATLKAEYSPNLSDVQRFIQHYGIDFFLVHKDFLKPEYLLSKVWLVNSSFQNQVFAAATHLQTGKAPALAGALEQCAIATTETLLLLDAQCVGSSSL
ncbi:MAG: hypothetical protein KME11_05700 [Timaviella obliquedivisa GSE-PSE-MK23-08B]|jgi:hypothetical protein|nr:hypothetical protein [Timaviella obliquedivisa GSE-PSE-MK23-08B]